MKNIILTYLLFCIASFAMAQYEPVDSKPQENSTQQSSFNQKVGIGGGLELTFGNVTNVAVSPRIEYFPLSRLSVGVGGTYLYHNNHYYNFETSLYGFSAFSSFAVVKDLRNILPINNPSAFIFHFEVAWVNLDPNLDFTANPPRTERFWLFQPQIGLGFKMPFGQGSSYGVFLVKYNIDEKVFSPYSNPVITYYIMF